MRRAIIVTKYASNSLLRKYIENKIYCLSGTESFIDADMNVEMLNLSKQDDNLLSMSYKTQSEEELLIEEIKEAINHAFFKGFDEISVLVSFKKSVVMMLTLLSLFKIFERVKLEIVDEDEALSIYQKGTHIINKGRFFELVLLANPEAVVSLEHASEVIKKVSLNDKKPYLAGIRFINRVAVLNVEKGEIILIKKEAH